MVVKIRKPGDLLTDQVELPATLASSWEVGQLLSLESNALVKLDAATEDATFAGIATMKKEANIAYPPGVVVMTRCIAEAPVASATYAFGAALAYNASNDNLEASTANTIAWAFEEKTAAVTSLKVLFDVVLLKKLIGVVNA